MVLRTWDPFADLRELQERINQAFQEQIGKPERREPVSTRTWVPRVDIMEDSDNIIVHAELPGMKREDMDVEVTNEAITIRGERKFEEADDGKNYVRVERVYGPFERSFTLSVPVKYDQIKASYKDGILEVVVPKAEETKPKKIQVSVE
jgi:HSP20 family protein